MSKTISHAVEVVNEIKSNVQLLTRMSNSSALSDEELLHSMESICADAFKSVATKHSITEATVRDQCTRSLGDVTTDEFFKMVMDYLAGGIQLRHHLNQHAKDQGDTALITQL